MRILNILNFIKLLRTLINVLKIYLITNIIVKDKKTKFVLFYFPIKAYNKNIIELSRIISKKKSFFAFNAYNNHTLEDKQNNINSIYLDLNYLKFIPFKNIFLSKINVLVSSYVIYTFLPNSKNVYISHDIYDTPMVNKKIENNLFNHLSKYDFIFVSSNIVKNYFINKFSEILKNKVRTKVLNTGYLKLDHVSEIIKSKKIKKERNTKVLLAPTAIKHYPNINMSKEMDKLIFALIKNNFEIIYRPHPMDLTNKGNIELVNKIINKYEKYRNFKYEISSSYLDSYSSSDILITDFSGTAYTYAFSTLKPVIFFTSDKKKLKRELENLFYFKDMKKVGFVINDMQQVKSILNKTNKNKIFMKKKIMKLREKRIVNFGKSLEVTKKNLEKILNFEMK